MTYILEPLVFLFILLSCIVSLVFFSLLSTYTFFIVFFLWQILHWYEFGEFCFLDLILIDSSGDWYPCKLKFGVDPEGHLACKISGGWVDYCTIHDVCQGDKIKACVMEPVHDYELYVSFYSAIGYRSFLDWSLCMKLLILIGTLVSFMYL
jgi:hypothetical protein